MNASGLPSIAVKRKLDPLLFKLNEAGALNGHVPITGNSEFHRRRRGVRPRL